ncbi:hypothetical protein ALQ63_00442 [Serratia plymuthica]|uniref:hypothetical protein n=1 Tax=Serratia plymuthica TaxID=82996 RepID=UPI0004565CD4|nr:hypothetical protein [Serratia plymuthica]AHY07376.1 hypothetical protein sch_12730 [Serratia plymuthica]MBL3522985.1 hypothetical protein [Serratia plymuthica]RMN22396.1 hypothetical protein ALQ63_00442 [Serratia plymuthica]
MKLSNVILLSTILVSSVGMSAAVSAAQRPAGVCTFIYSPVPYVTKDGKKIQAPNACVAKWWAVQGK